MLTTKKKIIIGLLIILVILFILTVYLLYTNFYYAVHTHTKENFKFIPMSIGGRYVRIYANPNKPINLAGVIFYDQNSNSIPTSKDNTTMNSTFSNAKIELLNKHKRVN
jgi:hypothetical protein